MKIGNVELNTRLALAPMAGVKARSVTPAMGDRKSVV